MLSTTTASGKLRILIFSFLLICSISLYFFTTQNVKTTPPKQQRIEYSVKSPVICTPYPKDKIITKAAVVFYDVSTVFELQLRWWYRSWVEMKKHELATLRTDLVIAVNDINDAFLTDLGCTKIERKSPDEPSRCILAQYKPHKLRNETVYDFYLKKYQYNFADSISVINELKGVDLRTYDMILRTDIDTWFTPIFGSLSPPSNCSLYVGVGHYLYEDYTRRKLERVAEHLKLQRAGINEPGSTYLTATEAILSIANTTSDLMLWMMENEWSPRELIEWQKAANWPYWHAGVLTMYATELAMNHVAGQFSLNFEEENYRFDCPSYEKIPLNTCYTLHAYQQDGDFSKFKHYEGKYDELDILKLKWKTVSKDYCIYTAVDSTRKTATELKEMNEEVDEQMFKSRSRKKQ